MHSVRFITAVVVVLGVVAGCQRGLIETPNLYLDSAINPFADVPAEFQSNAVDVLYATDRVRNVDKRGVLRYGYRRSMSLAFGSCTVEFGDDVPWDVLVDASRTKERAVKLPLRVHSIMEIDRFPETPAPLTEVNGEIRVAPEYVSEKERAVAGLHEQLRRRLALTQRKEAFIYVHGIHNTLEKAAQRMATMWHFLGREGVPIVYTWPAGHPGLLRNYTYDRESGQFTNFHLKDFITAVAACPELEKINIIAHSRGTDVATTALKELIIVSRARGENPQKALKINRVVLAAADISSAVLSQRFGAEQIQDGFESLTFYVNKNDRALLTAEWLFADRDRIGQIRPEELTPRQRKRLEVFQQDVNVIDSRIDAGFLEHSYFLDSPATLSDIILLLRYGRPPGAAHGRPLTEIAPHYYILDDDYPRRAAPSPN